MARDDCVAFLQWCLPRLSLRWAGFRRVRSQVCKRITRRVRELGLDGLAAYREHLEREPGEWRRLDALCRVTISRFYRDRQVLANLEERVLPELARAALEGGRTTLRAASLGCASGEEPYTLAALWRLGPAAEFADLGLEVVATDADLRLLARGRRGLYHPSSARDLPPGIRQAMFEEVGSQIRIRGRIRAPVRWAALDVRHAPPGGRFDLVCCRNLVFTYYDLDLQRSILDRLAGMVGPGGALVIGGHETLPAGQSAFEPWPGARATWRRVARARPSPAL